MTVPAGSLTHICRHPIKAHGREELASVRLSAGRCLPGDRQWAVAHEAAKLAPNGGWVPCANFLRGAKNPALMAITSRLEGRMLHLSHHDLHDISFAPDTEKGARAFLDWIAPLALQGRAAPMALIRAEAQGMTDSPFPSVAILNHASNRALAEVLDVPDLSIHRWRGNLWLDGMAPWEEFSLVGRQVRIGEALLEVRERITRCRATMADPETGRIDLDTLSALRDGFGHQDFGVYAVVIEGGDIRIGDHATLL